MTPLAAGTSRPLFVLQPEDLFHVFPEHLETFVHRHRAGVDDQLGLLGRFIRGRDAGEVGDLALAGQFIVALGVAALADLQAGAQVNFMEMPSRRLARAPPVGPVGGMKAVTPIIPASA